MSKIKALLVTKGHPFEKGVFFEMFDSIDIDYTHVEQPAARVFFNQGLAADYDVFVMYDMPGIYFGPDGPKLEAPDEAYKQGFLDLLASGKGMVFMHHALAGWPSWPEYAEIIGGRFLYLPAHLRGEPCTDSGYRHQVSHKVTPVANHEITAGLPPSFEMIDELYLAEVFEDSVKPLLVSDYQFVQENFYSAAKAALEGKMFDNEDWQHPSGSNLVGWTKHYGRSPIVYIQGGDDATAYENQHYRMLLRNAIVWAADQANIL
ncbi:MAG: type 1 glutamine amidotransferase [Candidatus Azotimanducaceae bacterium]|jgi:type 1 glutamine amidotransferase